MLSWKSLIVATGARELFLPFPGWTRPRVVGVGAIQALMKQGLDVRGKRVVVAGTGPLLLAVADLLRTRGANVPIILEQAAGRQVNRFALSLLRSPSKLLNALSLRRRLIGTEYATDSYPTSVESIDSGVRVHIRRDGRVGSIDGDLLACGFNLVPNNELPSLLGCELTTGGFARVDDKLRTTVKNVFAVGEVAGIGGADKAIIEGQIASYTAMNAAIPPRLARAHTAALTFSHRLQSAFALRQELRDLALPETIICRCEDVPRAAVEGSIGLRDAKLQTRCGMGPCQGRVCAPIMQHLFGHELPRVRPPLFPTSVGTLMAVHGMSERS